MQQKRCHEFQDDLRILNYTLNEFGLRKAILHATVLMKPSIQKKKKRKKLFPTFQHQRQARERGKKGEKNLESLKGINGYKSEASLHEVNLC